jgi:FAM32A
MVYQKFSKLYISNQTHPIKAKLSSMPVGGKLILKGGLKVTSSGVTKKKKKKQKEELTEEEKQQKEEQRKSRIQTRFCILFHRRRTSDLITADACPIDTKSAF